MSLPNSVTMEAKDDPTEQEIPAEDAIDDYEGVPHPSCNYCTFAVTGPNPSWQPILICHECFNENEDQEVPMCICQACADICHSSDDHDVEYIGMGPSYCDCDCIGNCTIVHNSLIEAKRLGMESSRIPEKPSDLKEDKRSDQRTDIMCDVYSIPTLQDSEISSILVEHAQELIKYSKETHWVDKNSNLGELCPLEKIAWKIFQHHSQQYESTLQGATDRGGAEWWIQVKDTAGENTAIDLHYDKDEALAESFGTIVVCDSFSPSYIIITSNLTIPIRLASSVALGSFPSLSTVTYLTASSSNAAPTIVFDHTYSQGEDDVMNSMLVSQPKLGKHLLFDGTLLHGAPAHALLKATKTTDDDDEPSVRVTFLVNVWKDRRPASVLPLANDTRQKLICLNAVSLEDPLIMTKEYVPSTALEKEDDIPEPLRQRIELPFVTKGITWENQLNVSKGDDDDDGGLVVVTFPPSHMDHDTALFTFGPGLQAYLDYYVPEDKDKRQEKEQESGYV
jgi:hypothetical protein